MDDEEKYIFSKHQREIINDLKFIGSVPQKCKINTNDKTIGSESSVYNNFKRFWKSEDRKETVRFVSKRIEEGLAMFNKITELWKKKILVEALLTCVKGLNNLKATYFTDNLVVAEIDTLIKQINNAIEEEGKKDEELFMYIKMKF